MTTGAPSAWRPRPLRYPLWLADPEAPPLIVSGPETRLSAEVLQQWVARTFGQQWPLADDSLSARAEPPGQVVALGNLANNRFLRQCYEQYWCFTDRVYPGPGGWEVRTVHAPWGGQHSLVICGASDEPGQARAVERLTQLLSENAGRLGPLADVALGVGQEALASQAEAFEAEPLPKVLRFGITDSDHIDLAGRYYYLTGRPGLGAKYRECWLRMAAGHPERLPEEQLHLRFCWRVLWWDRLAEMPVFSEADRQALAAYIAEVLDGPEGCDHPTLRAHTARTAPRQNHQTHLALALIFGARYFRRAYEAAPAAAWEEAGQRLFDVYAEGWRPVETDHGLGYTVTLPDILAAHLLRSNASFIGGGGLRRAAELALLGCANRGFMPILGDTYGVWPDELLGAAAVLYGDGRYAWMRQRTRPLLPWVKTLKRAWAGDVPATPPVDLVGLRWASLDRLYYDLPQRFPEYAAQLYIAPPNVPFERTFDRLALRSGLEPDDQYLLIDGLGGGSHAFDDTNSIIQFDQWGRTWIATEDNSHWPSQVHHNLVTIVRDGLAERIPSFADLLLASGLEGTGFVLTAVHDYVGAEWRRALVWRRGDYVLVFDDVEAQTPGHFVVEARYRTLGQPALDGAVFTATQGAAALTLAADGADRVWVEPVDVSRAYQWDSDLVENHTRLYGCWPVVLNMVHLAAARELAPGEVVTLVAVLHARPEADRPAWRAVRWGRWAARLSRGAEVELAGVMPSGEFDYGGLSFRGAAFRLGAGVFVAAASTRLDWAGRNLLRASAPVDVELDRAAGAARLVVRELTQVAMGEGAVRLAQRPLDGVETLGPGEYALEVDDWNALAIEVGEPPAQPVMASALPQAARLPAMRLFTAEAPLCLALAPDGGSVTGGQGGEVVRVDAGGARIWSARLPGEVLSVATADFDGGGGVGVIAGGTGCVIQAFDPAGQPLWAVRPDFDQQFWPWWTLGEPQIHRLAAADVDGDGRPEVLAGVSNMRLHCYDAAGRERWRFLTEHGLFKTFVLADVDGDGWLEIVGGNDFLSSASTVRVIRADGREARQFHNQGWTAQVTAIHVGDIDADGALEIVCGTNRDDCLRVHRADGAGLRWSRNLGDAITGIAVAKSGNERLLVAGSRACYVSAFAAATGAPRWAYATGHAVTAVASVGEWIGAGTEDGRVIVLDAQGKLAGEAQLAGRISQLLPGWWGLFALGAPEGVWRVAWP